MELDKKLLEELHIFEKERNNLTRTLEDKLTNHLKNKKLLPDYDFNLFESSSQKINDELLKIKEEISFLLTFLQDNLENKDIHSHEKYQIFFGQVKKLPTVSKNVPLQRYINSLQIMLCGELIALILLQENNHKEISLQEINAAILKQTKENFFPDFIKEIDPDSISKLCKNNSPTKLTEKIKGRITSLFQNNNETLRKEMKIIAESIEKLKPQKKETEFKFWNHEKPKQLQDDVHKPTCSLTR